MLELSEEQLNNLNKDALVIIASSLQDQLSIPAPFEPPVRILRASIPGVQSHCSGGGNYHSGN